MTTQLGHPSAAGYRYTIGLAACRAALLAGAALWVAVGFAPRVGYGVLMFQGVANIALIVAVLVGRRAGAAVSMTYVGYDMVMGLLLAEFGWRAGVRLATGLLMLVALGTIVLGRATVPDSQHVRSALIIGALAGIGMSIGVVLG